MDKTTKTVIGITLTAAAIFLIAKFIKKQKKDTSEPASTPGSGGRMAGGNEAQFTKIGGGCKWEGDKIVDCDSSDPNCKGVWGYGNSGTLRCNGPSGGALPKPVTRNNAQIGL